MLGKIALECLVTVLELGRVDVGLAYNISFLMSGYNKLVEEEARES